MACLVFFGIYFAIRIILIPAVGNGGFSWRNRDLSLKIVRETNPPLRDFPEDWYMAKHTTKYGGTVAPW